MMPNALPSELWLQVFRWAITPLPLDCTEPFQKVPFRLEYDLTTKRALALVSKYWKNLSAPLLYEAIVIRYGVRSLERSLKKGFGQWVKLVEVLTVEPVAILELCPNLQIFVKPSPAFGAIQPIALRTLQHVIWTGQLYELFRLLAYNSEVRALTITDTSSWTRWHSGLIHLPELTTLRLVRSASIVTIHQLSRVLILPSLVHLCVDTAASGIIWISRLFSRIQRVDLGDHMQFAIHDHMTPILEHCTYLTTLNYYVHFMHPPIASIQHTGVKHIGLHCRENLCQHDQERENIEEHFTLLVGNTFPALEKVVLYGDWEPIIRDASFRPLMEGVYVRNCVMEFEDGRAVIFPVANAK